MVPSDDPSLSPPASESVLPLPPSPTPPVGDGFASPSEPRPLTATESLSVALVCLLAFLLASFPARNADVWGHLATGRLVVREHALAPLDIALPAVLQPRATWLYDVVLYGLYAAVGGSGLVLLKAGLVALLALALLRLSWPAGPATAAASVGLALLAMGTRLPLQPATVSCLFLSLVFLMLWPFDGRERRGTSWLPPLPLLLLLGIWANSDPWFLVGVAAAALVEAGGIADGALPPARGVARIALLIAVCLLNPVGLTAFDPRPLLTGGGLSPIQRDYMALFGYSPASLAYYPLFGLGLLSFVTTPAKLSWRRLLPWLGLAVLSGYQGRAVPFFAVVAGPALALNVGEILANRPRSLRDRAAARALAFLGLAVLVVCAWPGWLQSPPYEPRRWEIETSPALAGAAEAANGWRREGLLPADAQALHLATDSAATFAWFAPDHRGLVDPFLASAFVGLTGVPEGWVEGMRAANVDHVVVALGDRQRQRLALERLLGIPELWPLLYLEGDVAVFGWRDPARRGDPFRGRELDPTRLAFRPPEAKRVPPIRPDTAPVTQNDWWEALWKKAPPRPVDRDEAALHLLHAEALRTTAPQRQFAAWVQSQTTGLIGAAAGWSGPGGLFDAHLRFTLLEARVPPPGVRPPPLDRLALSAQQLFSAADDQAPSSLLYLAIRAARRAVVANPDDARAHFILAESYLRLMHATRERVWGERLPELSQLRRAQASAALNRAVALDPTFADAHFQLGYLYREIGYLDLSLKHLQTFARLTGLPAGEAAPEGSPTAQIAAEVERLAKDVKERENAYGVAASTGRVADRAMLAARHGLAGHALKTLLDSDIAAFGPRGMALQLELMLRTDRAADVVSWVDAEKRASLSPETYHWLRAQALAATGDYPQAQEECHQLAQALGLGEAATRPRDVAVQLIGKAVLDEAAPAAWVPALLWRASRRGDFQQAVSGIAQALQREANATVLRGLLLLEEGNAEEAAVAFRVALALWGDDRTAASGGGLDFGGRTVAQEALRWLE